MTDYHSARLMHVHIHSNDKLYPQSVNILKAGPLKGNAKFMMRLYIKTWQRTQVSYSSLNMVAQMSSCSCLVWYLHYHWLKKRYFLRGWLLYRLHGPLETALLNEREWERGSELDYIIEILRSKRFPISFLSSYSHGTRQLREHFVLFDIFWWIGTLVYPYIHQAIWELLNLLPFVNAFILVFVTRSNLTSKTVIGHEQLLVAI